MKKLVVMYEFWYDYVKPKYGENARLCYMDTDSFTVYIKTEDTYAGIAKECQSNVRYLKLWNYE